MSMHPGRVDNPPSNNTSLTSCSTIQRVHASLCPVHWAAQHRPLCLTPLWRDRVRHDLYKDRAQSFMCSSMSLFPFTSICSGLVNLFTRALRDPSAQSFIHPFFHIFQSQIYPSIHLPIVNSSIRSSVHSFIYPFVQTSIHSASHWHNGPSIHG